ncbi:BMP family ABC transporter substrate-binding protein [Evansella sp. AB-rgal1]|uniref:BMP family ABC transporter substrate-binding protein n=1 Tax=Evansella sp. AB-rgal1 TaxID=3242696 RepID=UPI00359D4386
MNYCLKIGLILILLLSGCVQAEGVESKKIGLILSSHFDDQGWNSKAYQALLSIQSNLGVEVYVEEDVKTKDQIIFTLEKYDNEGISLVFGHSSSYGDTFMEIKEEYPNIHFVVFNAEVEGDNITGLHFEGYSMGYFAGMLASEMTETNKVGIIAAFPFQPEVIGFQDGASFHNPDVEVTIGYTNSWINEAKAIEFFDDMNDKGVDIFYPAGDGFHIAIVEKVKGKGNYAIGYVGDQIDLGESTILTSTVQHVEKLYEKIAKSFIDHSLESGNMYFDFSEGVISLGEFSKEVPEETQQWIRQAIEDYIQHGKLPHELID